MKYYSNERREIKMSLVERAKSLVQRRVPISSWLPRYRKIDAVSDAIAGITVGLTMMPQSIAYASLAGLSAQYGLYSAFMGSLVYVLFGTVKEVSIGPTSLMALLTFEYTQDLPIQFVTLLAFLSGCVELLMGFLNLGFLVNFISAPVMSGFTSATSIIIVVSQLKGLLGIRFKSHNFIDNIRQLILHVPETKLWDSVLGGLCIVFLLGLRKLKDVEIGPVGDEKKTPLQRRLKKALWFLSISRNALMVLVCSIIAFKLHNHGLTLFRLSGKVEPGLPAFRLPPFSVDDGEVSYSFIEMCKILGSGIIVVPVIAVLANVAIAKAFASGTRLDATQEMFTLGLCNIFGSCAQAFPTCGAFTRSAVSNASGARTPMVGLYSGTIILLSLSYLTPYFYYIPRSTLSAVLISAVMFMVEYDVVLPLWRSKKRDFVVMVVTFVVCLLCGVEMGLVAGVLVDMSHLLFLWARPSVQIVRCKVSSGDEYVLITPDMGIFYAAVDFICSEIGNAAEIHGEGVLPIVVDCVNMKGVDYSTAVGMKMLLKEFEKKRQQLMLVNVRPAVADVFAGAKVEVPMCNSEDELLDILFGDKDISRPEMLPILRKLQNGKRPEEDMKHDMSKVV